MSDINYINAKGEFLLKDADMNSGLYFPLVNDAGMMSSVTPELGGDCKIGQNNFLLAPASNETLHESRLTRNFWCKFVGNDNNRKQKAWSATGISAWQQALKFTAEKETVNVSGGLLWHKVIRENANLKLKSEILSFVPVTNDRVEIMQVTITNNGDSDISFIPVAAIPLYGRSADNIRDHRHVTSLLQRVSISENALTLCPALTFDERGHRKGEATYIVAGTAENGENPSSFIPLTCDFIGEGGSYDVPQAIFSDDIKEISCPEKVLKANSSAEGYEMTAALVFNETTLKCGKSKTFQIVLAINTDIKNVRPYLTKDSVQVHLENVKQFWQNKCQTALKTGNNRFDSWFTWVSVQPVFRRIFGCSFLPHHDYGKGGRGWRDLWQDCLALILIEPSSVREMLMNHFGGIRTDGSNATIIGSKMGEFIADRNNITRVWMDHGMWPLLTVNLYINQTGDLAFLLEKQTYFRDRQLHRGEKIENPASVDCCTLQKDSNNEIYLGTLLEHLMIQNLTAFFDVGEHNIMKLRGADWNDGLDMAREHGESVAFTAAYAGNFDTLIDLISALKEKKKIIELKITKELLILLDKTDYKNPVKKVEILNAYCTACEKLSGDIVSVSMDTLIGIFEAMSKSIKEQIRNSELVSDGADKSWFNSYYDNNRNKVDGVSSGNVRMMLTGQVFTILSGTATPEQSEKIIKAVNQYLCFPNRGGYALNTDFKEIKTDLGRMFGFAYGHKENGAVFSHMAVMYAYALYSKGYVNDGYKVISMLFEQSDNFELSRIYPGIPEYFDIKGRGMYPYLTGAASWLLLTLQTEVFGINSKYGDLVINPKLVLPQFDKDGKVQIKCSFANRKLTVEYINTSNLDYKDYDVKKVIINDKIYTCKNAKAGITIPRADIITLSETETIVKVILDN